MRPVSFNEPPVNADAYAAQMPDRSTHLVLLNKDADQTLEVSIDSPHDAKVWRLQASGLTATSGITLAGTEIKPDKTWQPGYEEQLVSHEGRVRLAMEPASGAALFFRGSL